MKKAIISLLIILPFIYACSDSDNDTPTPTIAGEWSAQTLTIHSSSYDEDIDPYVKKAFSDILEENKIKRIFTSENNTVETKYTNSLGSEVIYSTQTYEIKKDSLYLKSNNNTTSCHFSVSEQILTTRWQVDKKELVAILLDMEKQGVAMIIPEDYTGTITFIEKR
jgi:hypothetical protein